MSKTKTPEEKIAKALARALYEKIGKQCAHVRKQKRFEKRRQNWKLKYPDVCPCCGKSRYGCDW